jgi:type VI secretion system protein ImpE
MTTCQTPVLGDSLAGTLEELTQQIRKQPADVKLRIFLFQLLAVTGDWQRAQNQLNVCGQMDDANLAMMHAYRAAIHCEALRSQVFSGLKQPLVFGEPQEWIASLLEALRLEHTNQPSAAAALRNLAYEQAPATAGQITTAAGESEPFSWIADGDSRIGPMLEAIIEGKYYWIPWSCLTSVDIEPPHDLRDVVWLPAYFTWTNGGQAAGFIPTRYAGSEVEEDALRLARRTEWNESKSGAYLGLGQRMFTTDQAEYAVMEIRKVVLHHPQNELRSDGGEDESADG